MPYAIPTAVHEPLLIHGDCIEELRKLPANSVDAYVSDPPSAIAFMGRKWDSFKAYEPVTERGREVLDGLGLLGLARGDRGFVAFMVEHWTEVRRVLKPGAYVVAWALPKTSDLAGLAMRLAGFDMELPLLHLFGSAMPKGKNVSKAHDEMAGAEREVMGTSADFARDGYARRTDGSHVKPGANGTMGAHADRWAAEVTAPATDAAERWDGYNTQLAPGFEHWLVGQEPIEGCTPERLREITGLDYSWTTRDVKTPKQRRKASLAWPSLVSTLPGADLTDWARAVLACAALEVLGEGRWQTRRGRSLRASHANVEQLLRDGEVKAERETSKYSGAPLKNVAANVLAHGCGALHVRACEIPRVDARAAIDAKITQGGGFGTAKHTFGEAEVNYNYKAGNGWPKNVILSTGGECCPAAELDRQSGVLSSGGKAGKSYSHDTGSVHTYGGGIGLQTGELFSDSGGASRFYTQLPIDDLEHRYRYAAKARKRDAGLRSDLRNDHNTIKTVALMRWIMRLVVPTSKATGGLPGVVLSTFLGSGTDGVAAIGEGFRFVGIERDGGSFELATSRIMAAIGSPEEAEKANALAPTGEQLELL